MTSYYDDGEDPYYSDEIEAILRMLDVHADSVSECNVPTWEEAATSDQQRYYELLGDRLFDSIGMSEMEYLELKVGFALYGPPQKSEGRGYSSEQMEHIKEIVSCILQNQNKGGVVLFATIFVVIYMEDFPLIPVPIFRVPKINCEVNENCEMTFIDSQCRVYASWNNYLTENVLPKCKCCYPKDGIYKRNTNMEGNHVLVEFADSPACSWSTETLSKLDAAGIAASLGLTVVGLAALAVPVAAPVMAAAAAGGIVTGAYSAGRSAGSLMDRARHGQSISVTNTEARSCWLSIGGSIGLASSQITGLIASMARNGQVASNAACLAADLLNVSSLTVSGLGIANGAWMIYMKYQSNELTYLDLFQFTSSVLFFTNSAMNIQTANSLIKEVQNNTLDEFRASLRSNRHRKAFDKMARNTRRGMERTEGNARIIKGIRHINDKDNFFAGVVRTRKQFGQNRARTTFTENGHMEINSHFEVHPMDFSKISKSDRQIILEASNNLNDGTWTNARFQEIVEPIFNRNNIPFNSQSTSNVQNLCKNLGTISLNDVQIGGKHIFSNMSGSQFQQFETLIQNIDYQRVFRLAAEMANYMNCETAADFFSFMEYACPYFAEIFKELRTAYDRIREMQRLLDSNFNQERFLREFLNLFTQLLRNIYGSAAKFREFKKEYDKFRRNRRRDNHYFENGKRTYDHKTKRKSFNISKSGLYAIASEIAINMGFVSNQEFFDFMEFACPYLEGLFDEMEETYQRYVSLLVTEDEKQQFDKSYDIKGGRGTHFMKVIKEKYSYSKNQKKLMEEYRKWKLKAQTKSLGVCNMQFQKENTVSPGTNKIRLSTVLENRDMLFSSDDISIDNIAVNIAKKLGCYNNADFVRFTAKHLQRMYNDMEETFQNWLAFTPEPNKSVKQQEIEYGVIGNRREYFLLQIENMYELKDNLEQLQEEYTFLQSFEDTQDCSEFVFSDEEGLFVKSRDFKTAGKILPWEYYSMAQQLLGVTVHEVNTSLLYDNNVTFVTVEGNNSVMISSDLVNNTIKAYVISLEQ